MTTDAEIPTDPAEAVASVRRLVWMLASRYCEARAPHGEDVDENLVDDLAAEVLLVMLGLARQGKYDQSRGKITTWATVIARCYLPRAYRVYRAMPWPVAGRAASEASGHPGDAVDPPDHRPAPGEPDPVAERERAIAAVDAALLRLSDRQRLVVAASYGFGPPGTLGRTYAEIAGELRISRARVHQLRSRARERLRVMLCEDADPDADVA